MKNMNLRVLTLVLIFGAQVFAQRFTSSDPDIFETGYKSRDTSWGYISGLWQAAALGEKNSSYANLMLLGGIDSLASGKSTRSFHKVIDSHGNEYGDIRLASFSYIDTDGKTAYDNTAEAVIVLDSFSDNKKAATVLLAALKRLIIVELRINNFNKVEYTIVKNLEMPEAMARDGSYYRSLALLGTSNAGGSKTYHIAVSDPNYKNKTSYSGSGRIEFYSIKDNPWSLSQPNTKGIVSGDNVFNQNAAMGISLVSVGDLDGNGYNDLAVLFSAAKNSSPGAIYIFFMDNEYTPNLEKTATITGESMPWIDDTYQNNLQKCTGMSYVTWNNESRLLLSCNATLNKSFITFIKDITLNSSGSIETTNIFSLEQENDARNGAANFNTISNPIPIKNHKNSGHSIALTINGPCLVCSKNLIYVYRVADADASKNFSIEAGKEEFIADIDSLFYKSGAQGYSAKTLSGLAKCRIQNANELACTADKEARGSWSMVELSSNGICDQYRGCKIKDTIYVYARTNLEPANTALRIPKDLVIGMQNRTFVIDSISSLAYFRNPGNLNTNIAWDRTDLEFISIPNETGNNLSIAPLPHIGTDSLVFSLTVHNSTNKHSIRIHVADTSEILNGAIPATPGNDTIWNIAQKKYIALPPSNSNGSIYTYDIAQNDLGKYAEILGDYLHILNIDVAKISVAYTENSEIKHRKIVLMPEPKPSPPSSSEQSPILGNVANPGNIKAFYSGGNLHVNGVNGELGIRAYNFKGVEIQREKVMANGSASLKLKQHCPQIVQISTPSKKIYITIFP
jgi:hypothetical protein